MRERSVNFFSESAGTRGSCSSSFCNNFERFIGYAFGFTFLFVNFMSYVVVYNLL